MSNYTGIFNPVALDGQASCLLELIDYYCPRCKTGMYNCKLNAKDCPVIQNDRDYEEVSECLITWR